MTFNEFSKIKKEISPYSIPLQLSIRLQNEGIVKRFVKNKKTNSIVLELNHKYEKSMVFFTIDTKTFQKNLEMMEKSLKDKNVNNEHIRLIKNDMENNWKLILGISDASDPSDESKNNDKNENNKIDSQPIYQQQQEEKSINNITISPSQALRKDNGTYKVKGTIISISKLFKMISKIQFNCNTCHKNEEFVFPLPEFNIPKNFQPICENCKNVGEEYFKSVYINAVGVELQDAETFNDFERLPVFLFDQDTAEIRVGETVTILGDINIINAKKRYFTYLYGKSIQYLNREDFTLSKLEIDAINRFSQNKFDKKYQGSVIAQLVKMFDPSIVEHDNIKKGILMSAVNTSEKIKDSEHIDVLFIGPPGTGKSKILRRATEMVPGSSNAGGQYSSGKSLTAIIDKTDDNTILRLGLIPRSRGAFCAINEFGRQPLEDQDKLLDVMQERWFPFDKYGIHANIPAPTTILASANPINKDRWIDNDKIDFNEFPFLEPIKDRFGLIFSFHDKKTKEERNEFAEKLSEVESNKERKQVPDYTYFLTRYIHYAKQIEVTLTDEARTMLTEFYKNISNTGFGSPRVLVILPKLTKAVARLKLKNVADEEDAKEVMEFYNSILVKFQKSVVISQSPKDVGYEKGVMIVERFKEFEGGVTLEKIFEIMCKENEQLTNYFGYGKKSLKIKHNHKTRSVYEMLLGHSNLKKIQENPIVLKWMNSQGDTGDARETDKNSNKIEISEKKESDNETDLESTSPVSPVSLGEDWKEESDSVKLLKRSANNKCASLEKTKERYDSGNGNKN